MMMRAGAKSALTACLLLLAGLPVSAQFSDSQAATPMPVCNLAAADAMQAGAGCRRAWQDANIRISDLQLVGTAESYKQEPSPAMMSLIRMGGKKDAEALDFGQAPITAQLDTGARALQFDIANDPKGGLFKNPAGASMAGELLDADYVAAMSRPGFKVIHVLDVDFRSSCTSLKDCLTEVAAWSRAHKDHMPIVIALRTNDTKTPMPGATHPLPFDAAAFAALDKEVLSVFQPGEIITPDMVQGKYASLREAVTQHQWPSLGASRGKIILVMDDCAEKVALYTGATAKLSGRPMFVTTDENSPLASFITIEDPVKDGARIEAAVKAGFIVRTRADDPRSPQRRHRPARKGLCFGRADRLHQFPGARQAPRQLPGGDDQFPPCFVQPCRRRPALHGLERRRQLIFLYRFRQRLPGRNVPMVHGQRRW